MRCITFHRLGEEIWMETCGGRVASDGRLYNKTLYGKKILPNFFNISCTFVSLESEGKKFLCMKIFKAVFYRSIFFFF